MISEYKERIELNNNKIVNLKNVIKKHYDREVEVSNYKVDDVSDLNELEKILKMQAEEMNKLDIIVDIEAQNFENEMNKKIEELKVQERDKEFSDFYRNGFIEINGINVSVDKFYIKEIENNLGEISYNFVCTDKNINNSIFNSIDYKDYKLKKIYKFKDSKVFYEMYLDKSIYVNGRILIDTDDELNTFNSYVKKWTSDNHMMVAELII